MAGSKSTAPRDPDELGEEELGLPKRYGMPVDRYRVMRALLRGKWWLLAAATVGLAVGVGVAKYGLPRTYLSESVLRFEGTGELPGLPAIHSQELPALVDGFFVEPVLGKVKKKLDLGPGLSQLAKMIEVQTDAHAGSVRVNAGAETPAKAAKLVDTLVGTFLDHQKDAQVKRIDREIKGLDGRIAAAKADLESARRSYDSFRDRHGINDLTAEAERAITNAAEMRAQAQMAESEIGALQARIEQIRKDLRTTPRMVVATSQSSSPERQELARLETELARARSRLSEDHPKVQALNHQIGMLKQRLTSGSSPDVTSTTMGASASHETLQTALTTAQADLEAARERHQQLGKLADEAQGRIGEFSEIEGEASALLAQVRMGEELLTSLHSSRARLEDARRQPSTGFAVVASASVPEWPERDKRRYLAAGGFPLVFVLLAAFVFLFQELKGLRVMTPAEVGYWGRGPVIGTTTWPRNPKAIEALIADLDDFVPDSRGRMLLVGATERDAKLARELASELNNDWVMTTLMSSLPATTSTALAPRRAAELAPLDRGSTETEQAGPLQIRAWEGEQEGQGLRRAARLVDRVAVVVTSGSQSVTELRAVQSRLGRSDGIGYIVVGIDEELSKLPDRSGPVEEFWRSNRRAS